jgi:alkylhydroperoxidase family enzyme
MARIPLPGDGDELGRAFALASPAIAAGAGAFSAAVYGSERIPVRLRELMRMRVAQMNQCEI